ncbi:MAG: type II/IV secretion system protein [Actinomycetota bacterium]|nr:type II/IV secretion system protein [Actinomycetota bacterium]
MTGEAAESVGELTEQLGFCYVDLSRTGFAPGAAALLPEEVARRERAVPIERRGNVTVVAVSSPADQLTLDALRAATRGEVVAVVAPSAQITAAQAQLYGDGAARHGRRRGQYPGHWERAARRSGLWTGSSEPGAGPMAAADAAPPTWDAALDADLRLEAGAPRKDEPLARAPGAATVAHPSEAAPPEPLSAEVAPPEPAATEAAPPEAGTAEVAAPEPPLLQLPPVLPMNGSAAVASTEPMDLEAVVFTTSTPSTTSTPTGSSPPPPLPGSGSPGGAAADAVDLVGGTLEGAAAGSDGDPSWPALARTLVASGKVSVDNMARAVRDHDASGESLPRFLLRERLVAEDDLVEAMAGEVGLPFVDLATTEPDPEAAALVPASVARRHTVLPIGFDGNVLVVAMADPTDVFALDDLRSILGRNFRPVVATRAQIELYTRRLQEPGADVQEAAQHAAGRAAPDAGAFELESLQAVVEDAPIIRYVNLLILQALNDRASDIHIEPTPKRLRVRFRIDGVMHDAGSASPAIHAAVISRLKVLGDMDITEHRIPQEGRVSVSVRDRQIDLRLAVLPTLYGESCVMRLLDKSASIRQLSELGFFPDTLQRYAQAYHQPYGVILVTGPTGAGKTTTLYATLQEVTSAEKSVVTVEDPVEYQIAGITQVQINPKVGMPFSSALRSILRADPDIILVGEIRDMETATIAMEAALSGHLVLSTLHTNTAASTPLRLTEMGIEPFLVTSAVSGVLTQRLARVLCERCKVPFDASTADFYAAGYKDADLEGLDISRLYRASGCATCANTGYFGRMLLGEMMPMTEEIQRMIIEHQSILAMERQAVDQGMRTLRQDGLRKAIAGYTTLEEVLRVVA